MWTEDTDNRGEKVKENDVGKLKIRLIHIRFMRNNSNLCLYSTASTHNTGF